MAGISTQPVRLTIYAWRSQVKASMATANQKVAAAARMAVHTMIRANGWSLVWSGMSLMSEGECTKALS